jgi:hypothetical protein
MGNKLALRDGRTTLFDLEMGTLGTMVDRWYAERAGANQVNYGCAVSHEFTRALVLDGITTVDTPEAMNHRGSGKTGWSSTRPTLEQGNEILRVIDTGLAAGAIGMGSTLGYMRDGVSPREVFELQRLAGLYGRPSAFHFRYTPGTDTPRRTAFRRCWPTRPRSAPRRLPAISTTPATTSYTSCLCACANAA